MKILMCLMTLLVGALGYGCSHSGGNDIDATTPQIQSLGTFTMRETHEGKLNWEMDAYSADINETNNVAMVEKPVITFYAKGEYSSTLTAERGRINTLNYDIVSEGPCELHTVGDEQLYTTNLRYIAKTQMIETDEYVKIVRPGEIIEGVGMIATPDLKEMTIRNQKMIVDDSNAEE